MHLLLFYEKVEGFEALQAPLADAHRRHVMQVASQGAMMLAGSLGSPDDGAALILFEADSPSAVEAFANTDPYVIGGVVRRWMVRPWDLVVGAERVSQCGPSGNAAPG